MTFLGIDLSPEKYEYLVNIPREKLFSWLEAGIAILPNFAVALITLLMFYPIAKVAKWGAGKILWRKSDNIVVKELCKNLVFLIVLMIGVFSALEILNLEKTVASLLAGAGVIGLALGFAFQEIASNFVSGVIISFRKPYQIGDIIKIQSYEGSVKSIDLRYTSLVTFEGLEVIIPNKNMMTEILTNYTTTPERRVELNVGVAYDSDLEKVERVTKTAVENLQGKIKDIPTDFFYTSFADSAITFTLRFWVTYPGQNNFNRSKHEAIIKIKKAFDENGINIPFPIQTADMSMAIKQGITIAQL